MRKLLAILPLAFCLAACSPKLAHSTADEAAGVIEVGMNVDQVDKLLGGKPAIMYFGEDGTVQLRDYPDGSSLGLAFDGSTQLTSIEH